MKAIKNSFFWVWITTVYLILYVALLSSGFGIPIAVFIPPLVCNTKTAGNGPARQALLIRHELSLSALILKCCFVE